MTAGVGKRLTRDERARVVHHYQQGLSSAALGRRFGVTDVAIRMTLKRAGIARRGASESHQQYALDETVFDSVTPESAYWAGFLLADGAICDTEKDSAPRIEITLQARDREHVQEFRRFLGAGHPVADRARENSCRLAVRSNRLAQALKNFGVVPRKSLIAEVPEHLAHNVDFWRGVIDGDGDISAPGGCPRLKLVGSLRVTEQFARFCATHVTIERVYVAPVHSVFYAQLNGNSALTVMKALYRKGATSLKRKRLQAVDFASKYKGRVFRILPFQRRDPTSGIVSVL